MNLILTPIPYDGQLRFVLQFAGMSMSLIGRSDDGRRADTGFAVADSGAS